MDIKVTLNTRRVVVLSVALILFGLTIFLIGMVVGAKARNSEFPPQTAQSKPASLADKIPQKIPELEKPSTEAVAAKLPETLDKDKLAVPEVDVKKAVEEKLPDIDAKKEIKDKLTVPDVDVKKAVEDKLTPPEVDVKKEVTALLPTAKVKAGAKTAPVSADKDKKPGGATAEEVVEKKPEGADSKTDAKAAGEDEPVKTPKSSGAYTVQVGAFLEKNNAEVMLQDLRKKGYTPYIHTIWDDMKRQWHTVRLGNYEDQETASKSAADFTKKEHLPTSVRGVGVL